LMVVLVGLFQSFITYYGTNPGALRPFQEIY
jgi:hypothetical protein